MSARPRSVRVVRQWVERAEEDLLTAEHTLTLGKRCPFPIVCFHAQQCAEKYMKALLTRHSVLFSKTHDLTELLLLVPKEVGLEITVSDVAVLNRYAVETRYPGNWEPMTQADAEEAVALTRKVREAVRHHLPKEALGGHES